jgi:hypothetical protein
MNLFFRIVGRIQEFLTTQSKALSGHTRVATTAWARRTRSALMQPTKDWGRPNYAFWQQVYYCRARGLELSGLFVKPIVSKIAAWTLGMGVGWTAGNDAAQTALDDWWAENHAGIMRAMRASLKQGDAFLVINADLTLTLLPPDTVDPIVDEEDYGLIIGWRVTQVLSHPEYLARRMTLIDEYYPDRRVQRVERPGAVTIETTYPNLLGRLQIVHIANSLDESDIFGHPEAEALIELLHNYNETLNAALEGNRQQGRPTPVLEFDTRADLDKFWAGNGERENYALSDGTIKPNDKLNVDLSQLLTVSGAEFKYASPGSFTQDTERLLGLMFYLLLEHAEIPEFVFGNAIASSMASASTQMPVFERFIDGRRKEAAGWLVEIAEIVLGYLNLLQPGISTEPPTLQWHKLTQDGQLTLGAIQWAFSEGLIDERTALLLAPVEVQDLDDVLATAKQERDERMAREMEQFAVVDDDPDEDEEE